MKVPPSSETQGTCQKYRARAQAWAQAWRKPGPKPGPSHARVGPKARAQARAQAWAQTRAQARIQAGAQARAQAGPKPGPKLGPSQISGFFLIWDLETWKFGIQKIPKVQMLKTKIHVAQNVGKVWISRKKKPSRPHVGPSQAIFCFGRKNAKNTQILLSFLGGVLCCYPPLVGQ